MLFDKAASNKGKSITKDIGTKVTDFASKFDYCFPIGKDIL